MLVAGSGFCSFCVDGHLRPLAGMLGEYVAAEPVEAGWLLAGSTGVYLVARNGSSTVVMPATSKNELPTLHRRGSEVFIIVSGFLPRRWTPTELTKTRELGLPGNPDAFLQCGGLWFTTAGVFDDGGKLLLNAERSIALTDVAVVNGAGRSG